MNDEILDQDLSALLDGELAPDRALALRERIASDPALAARLDELASVNEGLRALKPRAMPRDVHVRLQARINLESTQAPERGATHQARMTPIAPMNRRGSTWGLPFAAALAAGLAAAWLLLPNSSVDESLIAVEPELHETTEVEPVPAFDEASDDELAIAFELENLRDLDLIQDLDLLEALLAMEDAKAPSNDNSNINDKRG